MASDNRVVTLERVDAAAMISTAEMALEIARSLTIDSDDMYAVVGEELVAVKTSMKELDERRKAITKPLDLAKAEVMDLFRKPIALREEAERIMKAAMVRYLDAKEEAERKARAEAARLARIAQEAAEAAAKEAADRARVLAEQAAAAKTLDDRQTIEEQQHAAEAEVVEQTLVAAAPVVYAAPAAPKAAGVSGGRIKYGAECFDKLQLIKFIAGNPSLVHLLDVNQSSLNKMASAQQEAFAMPGVRVTKERVIAART